MSEKSKDGRRADRQADEGVTQKLVVKGFRPALAAKAFNEGKYSEAVELCLELLKENYVGLSARLIYARSLYHTGRLDEATEQFHLVLSADPENIVALKYLGDMKFAAGDTFGAIADYERILMLDPATECLKSRLGEEKSRRGRITFVKAASETDESRSASERQVPFYTETLGDLYFAQGHSRLAAEVFLKLSESGGNERLAQKLSQARARLHEKES